jgi:hypothetical protein
MSADHLCAWPTSLLLLLLLLLRTCSTFVAPVMTVLT